MLTVYINGYWLDDKSKFKNYKCIVGKHRIKIDSAEDQTVFYYFDTVKDFEHMLKKNSAGRKDTEFVITSFRALCTCCKAEKPKKLGIAEKCMHCQKGNCQKCA